MSYLGEMNSKTEMRFTIVSKIEVCQHSTPGTSMAADGIWAWGLQILQQPTDPCLVRCNDVVMFCRSPCTFQNLSISTAVSHGFLQLQQSSVIVLKDAIIPL